jgi:hypothetical protein
MKFFTSVTLYNWPVVATKAIRCGKYRKIPLVARSQ